MKPTKKKQTIKLLDKAPLEEVLRIKKEAYNENRILEYLFLDTYIDKRVGKFNKKL